MDYIFQHLNELTDTELRVVMTICYCSTTSLSVADIQKMTNRGRQVYDAIKSLKQRGVITQDNPQIVDNTTKWNWVCTWQSVNDNQVTQVATIASHDTIEKQPIKSKRKSTPKGNPNQQHLAVLAYVECTGRRPKQFVANTIASSVSENESDIEFWKKVVTAWILQGWNPLNVDGMLNMFHSKTIPSGTAKRKVSLASAIPTVSVDEQANRLAEYLREYGDETN